MGRPGASRPAGCRRARRDQLLDASPPDPARFEAIYRANYGPVLAYARRRTSPSDAEEIAAEVFTVALRRLAELEDPVLPWLLGVARHALANRARAGARARVKTAEAAYLAPEHARDPADALASATCSGARSRRSAPTTARRRGSSRGTGCRSRRPPGSPAPTRAEKPDGSPLTDHHVSTTESWLHGERARLYADFGTEGWSDSELRADGSLRFRNGFGQDIVLHDSDGPDAVAQKKQLSENFVAEFRREYQQGTLDAAGTTTFAGKPAQRYVVDTSGVQPGDGRRTPAVTWSEHREFFVDATDGTPLGSISTSNSTVNGRTRVVRTTETVEAIEHRPPTPENLAQLEFHR
ncbi:hypothetical protein OM076_42315 [Solirubrobacter ginsenosidimutans]|uniref:RNA polymerase sigma-70 region 2 domain-containing protein n=1 Tax=Solirubrobacter ginsenosidimutans TaxID=490573 RepID=A0A9X3N1M1_9ACTN|nr:sigma factor [Solirubrobacter ginsenosidimutans]MDA0166971.1 hypothetical protein [Solirubrobacter ginsenosidimutans]